MGETREKTSNTVIQNQIRNKSWCRAEVSKNMQPTSGTQTCTSRNL